MSQSSEPDFPTVNISRIEQAILYLQQGEYEKIVRCYMELDSLEQLSAEEYNILGVTFSLQNQLNRALTAFENAYRLKQDTADICTNYLLTLLKCGKLSTALKVLKNKRSRVPYELGTNIMRIFSESNSRNKDFLGNNAFLSYRKILEMMKITPDNNRIQSFIFANTLFPHAPWREKALDNSSDEEISKWVSWTGLDSFMNIANQGRGVILLQSHFAMSRLAALLLARKGMVINTLEFRNRLGEFDIESAGLINSILLNPASGFYLAQVNKARNALIKGEIVQHVGDGKIGSSQVNVRFLDRDLSFRTGFAELALISKAPVIPVFCIVKPTGKITIDLHPPLDPGNDSQDRQQRIKGLVQQYATLLGKRWESDSDNITYKHIQNFIRRGYSFTGDQ